MDINKTIKQGIIVSCQALDGNPLRDTQTLTRIAVAAEMGGACGIRANGVDDIRSIRQNVSIPIIGILKKHDPNGRTIITPSFMDAAYIVEAGANIVALDATFEKSVLRDDLANLIDRIHIQLGVSVMADISNLDEALTAERVGADIISTTLSGYMPNKHFNELQTYIPDHQLIMDIVSKRQTRVPVIAEGRFWDPKDVQEAFDIGAYAVVIGKAITNPMAITQRYVSQLKI